MKKKLLGISYKNYINTKSRMKPLLEGIVNENTNVEVFVCPSIGLIDYTSSLLSGSSVKLCAQNIAPVANGAVTGEFSIESLVDFKGNYAELGHYERMTIFGESEEMVKDKIQLCYEHNITPLVCIGESSVLSFEEKKSFFRKITKKYFSESKKNDEVIIAYEPWWAIGQDESAKPDYVHESHKLLYEVLVEYFDINKIRIIYGGSVNSSNAINLLNSEYVDGLFVGRFGHKVEDFIKILRIVEGE